MRIDEIEIGGRYLAKVSGMITIVKVVAIREVPPCAWTTTASGRWQKRIDVVNERTGRRTTFRSAARLRSKAVTVPLPPEKGGAQP